MDVWPGKGCEGAVFGLCQYQRRVPYLHRTVPSGFEGGWLLNSSCKTQYAGEHSWEHFLKCHRQIVSLLDFWRKLGVTAEVSDEGEYWETRSEEKLKKCLRQYDGLMAMLGGMVKDAAEEHGKGLTVESPIFDNALFERLEHEGRQEFAGQIEPLQKEGTKEIL